MLIDARTIPEGQKLEVDVCIIGAGAAGITLAREFSGQPLKVAMVAGGGLTAEQTTQSLYSGPNVGLPYFALEYSRAHFFGGSTNWWGGHCRPLSDFDFSHRDWIPLSGWPITKKEIESYRVRAEQMCHLRSNSWEPQDLAADSGLQPLPLDEALMETRIAQVISPSPLRRFGVVYRKDIESSTNVDTYLNASVVEIDTDDTGKTVNLVKLACIAGPRFTIAPKMVVLAAGGLENPRLLLVSNRVQKMGLGNDNDIVGRYFLEHPRFDAGMFYPSSKHAGSMLYGSHKLKNGMAIKSYIGLTPDTMRREQINDVQFTLSKVYDPAYTRSRNSIGFAALRKLVTDAKAKRVTDDFGRNVIKVFGDIDNVAMAAYFTAFGGGAQGPMLVTTRVDPVPNPDSRVSLIDSRDELGMRRIQLDWRLSEQDKRSARRAMELFANQVGRAGMGRAQISIDDDGDAKNWPASLEGGWHHMGTTRMADDPKQGVVDRQCRVHGMSNLWVAGSSVFPTAGSGTPTLQIITLALRIAEDVKKRLA